MHMLNTDDEVTLEGDPGEWRLPHVSCFPMESGVGEEMREKHTQIREGAKILLHYRGTGEEPLCLPVREIKGG